MDEEDILPHLLEPRATSLVRMFKWGRSQMRSWKAYRKHQRKA